MTAIAAPAPSLHDNVRAWQAANPPFLNQGIATVLSNGFGKRDLAVFYRTDMGTRYLMFTTVPEAYRRIAAAVSTLGVAINVFLDDIADQRGDEGLIRQAQAWMLHGVRPEAEGLRPLILLWESYLEQITQSPNFQAYRDLLFAEWGNLINAMLYSVQVNAPGPCPYSLAHSIQMCSPNMHHAIKHVVDICYSPEWDPAHTVPAMELASTAQVVTRIGNWTKSWQQELRVNRDITSGVFAVAVDWGLYTRSQLLDPALPAETVIETILAGEHPILKLNAVDYLYRLAQERIDAIAANPGCDAFIERPVYTQALQQVIKDQAAGKDESR